MRTTLVIIALLVGLWLVFQKVPVLRETLPDHTTAAEIAPRSVPPAPIPAKVADIPAIRPAGSPRSEPAMRQHVFRFQLEGNRCTLEALEEVSGSFGRERAARWEPGMLCCRLRAEDGRILGERTLPAPDQMCVVLDPNDPSGTPTATRLTSDGPVVFQVRFADIAGAVRVEVARVESSIRQADPAAPVGPLLASIQIPPQ